MLYSRLSRTETNGLFLSVLVLLAAALFWLAAHRPGAPETEPSLPVPDLPSVNSIDSAAIALFDWKKALPPGLSLYELSERYAALTLEEPAIEKDTVANMVPSVDTLTAAVTDTPAPIVASLDSPEIFSEGTDSLFAEAPEADSLFLSEADASDSANTWGAAEYGKAWLDSVAAAIKSLDSANAAQNVVVTETTSEEEPLSPLVLLILVAVLYAFLVSGIDFFVGLAFPRYGIYPASKGLVPDRELTEAQKAGALRTKAIFYLAYAMPVHVLFYEFIDGFGYCLYAVCLVYRVFGRSTAEIHYARFSQFFHFRWLSPALALIPFLWICRIGGFAPYSEFWSGLSHAVFLTELFCFFYAAFQWFTEENLLNIPRQPLPKDQPLTQKALKKQEQAEAKVDFLFRPLADPTTDGSPRQVLLEIDLSRQDLQAVPKRIAQQPYLLKINLSYNKITKINEADFKNCEVLADLDLSYNELTALPDFLFTSLTLKRIAVAGNPIPAEDLAALQLAYPHVRLEVSNNKQRQIDKILNKKK